MKNDQTISLIWNELSPRSSSRREIWTTGWSVIVPPLLLSCEASATNEMLGHYVHDDNQATIQSLRNNCACRGPDTRRRVPRIDGSCYAQPCRSQRGLDDPPCRLHQPAFALERLTVEPCHQPLCNKRRRGPTHICGPHVAHLLP